MMRGGDGGERKTLVELEMKNYDSLDLGTAMV